MTAVKMRLLHFIDRVDLHLGNFLVAEGVREKLAYVVTKSRRLRNNLGRAARKRWKKLKQLPTTPSVAERRAFLAERLPDYMVPSQFVMLEELPLTSGGKLDRRALRGKAALSRELEKLPTTARDPVTRRLLRIWEDVLQVRPVQETDDFFALGGPSLLAVRLFTEIEKAFGQTLPLATLFQARRRSNWPPSSTTRTGGHSGALSFRSYRKARVRSSIAFTRSEETS